MKKNSNETSHDDRKHLILEKQIANVTLSPSDALAAYVVAYRALGVNKELAVACMEELVKRRQNGDNFDFESYIETETAKIKLPKGIDYAKMIKGMAIKK